MNKKLKIAAYILVISLIIALILTIVYYSYMETKRLYHYISYEHCFKQNNFLNISDIYDELNSGDIILFKGYYVNDLYNVLNNSFFGHPSILIKKYDIEKQTNILYILESNAYEVLVPIDYKDEKKYGSKYFNYEPRNNMNKKGISFFKNGVNVIPMLTRFKYTPSNFYVMRLNKPISAAMNDALMQMTKSDHIQWGIGQKISFKKKTYHCWQFIAHVLDQIGLTNNLLKSSNILNVCNKVSQIYHEKLNDGYQYEKPIQMIYDF